MSTTRERKEPPIGMFRAIYGAFVGEDLEYYPRRKPSSDSDESTIVSKELLSIIQDKLKDFSFDSGDTRAVDMKALIDRAKDSLEEVKKQTEYQDAKAGRLLTIIAFLTAAVGIVFGRFMDRYPLDQSLSAQASTAVLVTAVYGLFAGYLLCIASGAMVIFHAMSTRFVWPPARNLADRTSTGSFLFFQEIVRTNPEAWGRSFAEDKNALMVGYYKNYVSEAYLVAAKVADKLRYLDPGQRLLLMSIRFLLATFLVIIATFVSAGATSARVTTTQGNLMLSPNTATPASSPARTASSQLTTQPRTPAPVDPATSSRRPVE